MAKDEKIILKQQLFTLCLEMQTSRIAGFRKAMNDAQEAANSEEKSTAGDKYDTARAMSQNTRDMNAKQLQEALKDLAALQQIKPEICLKEACFGSIVKTSLGNYFIAISGGPFTIQKETYYCISPVAPVCQSLLHKKAGDKFVFRDTSGTVKEVF